MIEEYKPQFFKSRKDSQVKELVDSGMIREIVDNFMVELEDLFRIDFPFATPGSSEYKATLKKFIERYLNNRGEDGAGVWAYFPWRMTIVHLPVSADFFKLKTARNKFLINDNEQQKFYNSKIGIAGLSVGSSVVNSLVLSGGGGQMRIADFDELSIVNLNRLHSSVCDIGRGKAVIAARKVYEINPYQELEIFKEGITDKNIDSFFGEGDDKLSVFIEEMDDIRLKIQARVKARKLKIPVVMATDNGDNAIIDVERFDHEPHRKMFHGSVNEDRLLQVKKDLTMSEKIKLASAIVGADITPRTRMSLMQVGAKIPAWPQLGNAATLSGVCVSYIVRRIVTGQDMPSGRYEVSLDEKLDPSYFNRDLVKERSLGKKEFLHSLNTIFGEQG